ncbi:hypothetical protein GCM10009737_01920 [Nocardioides lentus]|uniref:2'-5' RNA ligase family protein n=1 Tax=Nocardioides lentus TaxID=338077 RepID=A0ABN2NWW4_9ACTN
MIVDLGPRRAADDRDAPPCAEGDSEWSEGHHVLVVPVPRLEPYVVERTRHHDASFLSDDPGFVHAHITLLAPWLDAPTTCDLDVVARIVAAAPAFGFVLEDVRAFPDGTLHLPPSPSGPFAALTAELAAAFPSCPPYAGRHRPVPHLTVDRISEGVTLAGTRRALGRLLPAVCRAERVALQWYANHGCRTVAEWELGRGGDVGRDDRVRRGGDRPRG